MKHEKVGVDPATGKNQCRCGELGFDHIREVLMSAQHIADMVFGRERDDR
jgi:hypothetical protein